MSIPADQRISQEEAEACLLSLFTGWQMLELLDKIKETSLYRHALKQKINVLMPELEKHVDCTEDLFSIDSEAMNTLMEHKRGLSLKICTVKPELQVGMNEVLEAYFNAPELTMHRLGLKITKR